MRTHAAVLLAVASCITMLAAGCTRNEVAHTEQALAAAAASGRDRSEPARAGTPEPEALKQATPQPESTPTGTGPETAAVDTLHPFPEPGKLAAVLESIYFDFDQHLLSPDARETLMKTAEKLKSDPQTRVTIAAHCDERGSDDYNLALSERRARVAMRYLVALGVAAERLTLVGYGKEKPLADGHDEASWARNRRDDFEIAAP